jgi:primosomal protein N' (replication factor Y)
LQNRIFQYLVDTDWVDSATIRKLFPDSSDALQRLQQKGLVEVALRSHLPAASHPACKQVELSSEQQVAVDTITASAGKFSSFLLHGITGSGKTEVYLEAAEYCIANGAQVLILVPEIALTPQLVSRVRQRLGQRVCVLHSALSDKQRYRAWWLAREGHVVAVLGTRSAVFTPLKSPGLILVDEEHDISYKQQDGFRYQARDLAIQRASMENIPVVLGSATPSMETRRNVIQGRHRLLLLSNRIGAATLPQIEFIDLKQHRPFDGFSMPLLQAIEQRLINREQSIIFLNRRGFAPIAQCPHCDWQAACDRCDARLTYHHDQNQFRCHHCGHSRKAEMTCAACGGQLYLAGAGTQRLEQHLKKKFPDANISRLDRDQITTQDKLERELEAIQLGNTDIIIGTQLIAKGHDFSRVTLVGVINSDQGLYSMDFRAPEYLFQQLTQVSGRAGRAETPGQVLIQTAHPDNHILQFIRHHDFDGFARFCLEERQSANYPPYSYLALWRAESTRKTAALTFLRHTASVGKRILRMGSYDQVQIMDAVISPMEKLAGRYRAQLMVRSNNRGQLHRLLPGWIDSIENDPQSRRARWSIDIDPMEMF